MGEKQSPWFIAWIRACLIWWLEIVNEKISCFEMTNFWALGNLAIFSNISKIRISFQIKLCKTSVYEMDLSKSNLFSSEEAINYIPRTEKKGAASM